MKSSQTFIIVCAMLAILVSAVPVSCGTLLTASMTDTIAKILKTRLANTTLEKVPTMLLAYLLVSILQYILSFLFGLPWLLQWVLDFTEVFILLRSPQTRDSLIEPISNAAIAGQPPVVVNPQAVPQK